MPKFKALKLSQQFILLVGLVIILGITFNTVLTLYQQQQTLIRITEKQGQVLADQATEIIFNPLYFLDISAIDKILSSLVSQEDVIFALVRGSDGQVLRSAGQDFAEVNNDILQNLTIVAPQQQPIWQREDNILLLVAPIAIETSQIGSLTLGISLTPVQQQLRTTAIKMVMFAALLIGVGLISILFIARYISKPVLSLTAAAEAIGRGDYDISLRPTGSRETKYLSETFNQMATDLQRSQSEIQEQVKRLETVAILSERLSSILKLDELLRTVVDQVKEYFGYYHVQIYLLDDNEEKLVVATGTGQAGAEMKAHEHYIPVQSVTNLMARAARTGQIVRVDDVQETSDWLPNPLLPDAYSEMAVPIILEERVVGVLDVQQNRIAGLDENDANLLRFLANQVAVALSNAHLFAETLQAKNEAEQAREETEIANKALEAQVWHTTGQAQLNDKMRGEQDVQTLANNIVQQLSHCLQAQIGALYIAQDHSLNLAGQYAYSHKNGSQQFKFGEGLVGQAALEKRPLILTDIPDDYITVTSGLGETVPKNIILFPFMYDERMMGVIELGSLTEFSEAQVEFMQTALNSIAIAFNSAQTRARINELLEETQRQAEELQAQSEELRVTNEELEAQTESLQASEVKLKEKQTELEATNTQLEEQAAALEEGSRALREKQAMLDRHNQELKMAQQELEQKADELALASKYKSEFLANMSHELRTPLNSLLILARILADNEEGNLTEEQIESAQIIYSGGNDLLSLINDILDLSKVESGKMSFNFEPMPLAELETAAQAQFGRMAEEKGLELKIRLADDLPASIDTDPQRIKQITKNLLSNAFKFTAAGQVSLDIYRPESSVDLSRSGLEPGQAIAIGVSDTGIGMTPEQQKIIFEAFQQADGSTSRQFGGTGLGLSISRELATKLGGQIDLESEQGQGSTFTLYLPLDQKAGEQVESPARQDTVAATQERPKPQQILPPQPANPVAESAFPDDRALLEPGDKSLLIIEDDPQFAKIVYNFAREKGFKGLVAQQGKTGLALVKEYNPEAIILDLNLPDTSGWKILETLKHDPETRHIPVHIISADEEGLDAYQKGAIGYLTKPINREQLNGSFQKIEQLIDREIKTLLLVEDDTNARRSLKKLLGGGDVQIREANCGQTALDLLKIQRFDCMILDLSLPDMSGFEVLHKMNGHKAAAKCPVIVYTGRDLSPEENLELMKCADSVIVKGVKSPERLLDETALFLHRVVADMPRDKQETIKQLYNANGLLKNKRILIVDDDMRNSFALSKLLSEKGIIVRIAPNGQKALDLLAEELIDLVLMDIMMPVMDGYEATRRIRSQQQFKSLPILALTAKAMQEDREKCLAAGANDYLSKPIDVDRLFSMLNVWLYQ